MDLTLHVGLKKTATSTLQHALHVSKGQLAEHGLLFPCTPVEHHRLARRLRVLPSGARRSTQEALEPILDELRSARPGRVLLSSEHFISAPMSGVEDLRRLLSENVPEARLRVLAYVREPVAFATSMCQQNVRNGVSRLADFYANPWPFPIAEWIGNYVRAFGRQAVTVRYFHPGHLVGGDILSDVLAALGVNGVKPFGRVPRLNPSVSLEGVMVADALASLRPAGHRKRPVRSDYRRPLSRITGAKFVLPADVQERVIAGCASDLAWLKSEFGLDLCPERVTDHPVPALTEEMALSRARHIIAAAEA